VWALFYETKLAFFSQFTLLCDLRLACRFVFMKNVQDANVHTPHTVRMHMGHIWHSYAFLGYFNCLDEHGKA
jgi:hypothetical protein